MVTVSSYALTLYFIKVKPLENRIMNIIDIFNEATITMMCYLSWAFSDYNPNPEKKFNVGWVYVGLIFLNLACNVFVLFYFSVFQVLQIKFCPTDSQKRRKLNLLKK